jgi:ADYC domain
MTRSHIYKMSLGIALCACGVVETAPLETATAEQAGIQMQGIQMQGIQMQGIQMQGIQMQGIRLDGMTLAGAGLGGVRVERGELVAQRGTTTLRGTALTGAQFRAQVRDPQTSEVGFVDYRIASVTPEDDRYDPTHTGHTYLYRIEQWVEDTASWKAACPADSDGRRSAIPIAAIWDSRGDRQESETMFTFGCTTGVIAKCYRWGYRPWLTGRGDMVAAHWTCTRVARADYCGTGRSHTREGTEINVWDNLPSPVQRHGFLPPLGMVFEAGWNTSGAVCLSRSRWVLDDTLLLAALCPDRLVPPGVLGTVCNTVGDVLGMDSGVLLFNESNLLPINIDLGLGILGL